MKPWKYYKLGSFTCGAIWLLSPLNHLFYQSPQVEEKASNLRKSNKLPHVSNLMRGICCREVHFFPGFPGLRPPYLHFRFALWYFVVILSTHRALCD